MSEGKKLPQYIAAVCICIGAMGTGTVLAWTSNITEDLKEGKLNDFKMDDTGLGWAGSFMTVGAMIMCFPIGWIADIFGRKPTVLLTTIPFVAGWACLTFAKHIAMIYAGRVLTGIAGGSFCVTAPLYTSEIAQTEIRGRLGTFFQLFITIGILLSNVFGYMLPMMLFNFVCMGIPVLFGLVFMFQPETPTYSIKKGKTENADKAFKRLRGDAYNPAEEIKAINEQIALQNKGTFWDTMKTKAAKKATLICFMLMFYQQLSGINAVIFYSGEIFISAGSSLPSHWCVIVIGIVQVIATVFSSWSIELLGRKLLLMASSALMALSCVMLGLFFTLKNHQLISEDAVKTIGFLPILSLIIFIIAFSIGLGPIPWLASSEIFPPEVMAKCGSAAATFNWFLAFLVTRFYLEVANTIGNDITFYIFAGISFSGIFFVLIVMPETKGKTFAQIQEELGS